MILKYDENKKSLERIELEEGEEIASVVINNLNGSAITLGHKRISIGFWVNENALDTGEYTHITEVAFKGDNLPPIDLVGSFIMTGTQEDKPKELSEEQVDMIEKNLKTNSMKSMEYLEYVKNSN